MNPDYASIRIPKSGGGIRVLHVPKPALKAEQKQILRVLRKFVLSYGPYVHGFVRNRSIKTNAENLIINRNGGYWSPTYLLKVDVKDFFTNVTDDLVMSSLIKEKIPAWLVQIIMDKCFINLKGRRVLPQGAPTSPALSAVVMKHLSFRLAGIMKSAPPWCPARLSIYADNISFACDSPVVYGWIPKIKYVLDQVGLEIKTDKIQVNKKPGRQIVCGVQINTKIGPPRQLWRNLRAEMHNAWVDRMAGMVPVGHRLDHATRLAIRLNSRIISSPGIVIKKNLPPAGRAALRSKTKHIEEVPLARWKGQIEFVKSLDPIKGAQLEKLFKKVEAICSTRGRVLSSAPTVP